MAPGGWSVRPHRPGFFLVRNVFCGQERDGWFAQASINASLMLRCTMRTTIDIPEGLLRRAKAEAALRGLRLKDIVRDALEDHLADGRLPDQAGALAVDRQALGGGCVFPLVAGPTGPVLRQLRAGRAQRLLDEDDVDREVHSR